jgi:hypothetical protein
MAKAAKRLSKKRRCSRSRLDAKPSESLLADLPPEIQAEFKAVGEQAKAVAQSLEAARKAAAPEMGQSRQARSELTRALAIEAGYAPSSMQTELFKRLDGMLDALKSSVPSPWQEEALKQVLEVLKMSSTPSPWQEDALRRIEASLAALKSTPKVKSSASSQSKSEKLGAQTRRAMASLIKGFSPDGKVPEDMSVEAAMRLGHRHVEPDPKKGLPQWDAYDAAIKILGRAPRRIKQ